MKKALVVHIDYGSRDNSGFYIFQILDNLELDAEVIAYVSKKFKYESKKKTIQVFDTNLKWIFNTKLRQLFKFIDLHITSLFIPCKLLFTMSRPIYLFVSLYAPFITYKRLFQIAKLNKKIRIIATVHDVIPLYNNYPSLIMCKQEEILKLADYLIVHTNDSVKQLASTGKRIFRFPFPMMELMPVSIPKHNNQIKFLFIGYLRKEKGIELLIEVWKNIQVEYPEVHLTIAGEIPFGLTFDFSKLKNFKQVLSYLSDDEYAELISGCDYVILPYTGGTNSGILSTVVSLNKPAITSDLPMFAESQFVIPELMFKAGSSENLVHLLKHIIEHHSSHYQHYLDEISIRKQKYKSRFCLELNRVYNEIFALDRQQ